MEQAIIEDISKLIRSIMENGFMPAVFTYLNAGTGRNGTQHDRPARIHSEIHVQAEAFLSLTADCQSRMLQLPFLLSGQQTPSENNGSTRRLFRKLKKQQMDLLAAITDEVEIITSIIQQSGKFRGIIQCHHGRIEHAGLYMKIIKDRLSNRPSPLQRIEAGEMTPQIEYTAQPVPDPIDDAALATAGSRYPEKPDAVNGTHPCLFLLDDANSDIRERLQQIADTATELKQGWKLLKKMVLKGCSRRMRRAIEQVVRRSEERHEAFNQHIMESRLHQLPAENTLMI